MPPGADCRHIASHGEADSAMRSRDPWIVAFAGQHWLSRYLRIRGHPRTVAYCLPEQAVPAGGNPFAEAGQWQLNAALSHGSDRVWLMTLSESPNAFDTGGGTAQLMEAMHRYTGQVITIDAARLLRKTRERRRN
jgi:hypothetical protein